MVLLLTVITVIHHEKSANKIHWSNPLALKTYLEREQKINFQMIPFSKLYLESLFQNHPQGIVRREEGHILRRAVELEVVEKKLVGKPRKTWRKGVEEDLRHLNIREDMVDDRQQWR